MIKLRVGDIEYAVEFRHVTKLGKRAQLYSRSPIKAITTCVIAADKFIAVDNAVCAQEDNFSRIEGRLLSLKKVLRHCGALKDIREAFWTSYLEAANIPWEQRTDYSSSMLLKPPPARIKVQGDPRLRER